MVEEICPVDSAEAFFAAVIEGDTAAVRALLDSEPALLAAYSAAGVRAPLTALYHGHRALSDELAGRSSPLDVHEASAFDDNGRLRTLLQSDRHLVSAWSLDGWQPLHLAAFFGRSDPAHLLLDDDADVDAHSRNNSRATPLHCAAAGRHSELVWLLIASGAEVSARQRGGRTALHLSIAGGDVESVRALLTAGADPDTADDDGVTARAAAPAELAELFT